MTSPHANAIYWGLIVVLAAISAALAAFPPAAVFVPGGGQMPAPPFMIALVTFAGILVVYGGLGLVGLRLSTRVGFAGIWDDSVTDRQRFGVPLVAGVAMSVFFVLSDVVLAPVHGLGRIPHPPFPISLGASLSAGIGEEVLFRLFFISLWVWLVSRVLLRGRASNLVFGVVTGASAVLFTVAHFPMVMLLMGIETVREIPWMFAFELLLMNGTLSIVAALFMRRWGILSAMGLHFWTDVGWHVVWGSSALSLHHPGQENASYLVYSVISLLGRG